MVQALHLAEVVDDDTSEDLQHEKVAHDLDGHEVQAREGAVVSLHGLVGPHRVDGGVHEVWT